VEAQVVEWIGAFSYPAVFILLVLCGVGAPLSEDLIIVTGGIVAARSGASLPLMMFASFVGILVGDSLLYRLGRGLGPRVFSHPKLKKILTPSRIHFLNNQFARRGAFAVFLVRFMPGFRAPSYLLSGASGFPYRRFLLADAAGAAIVAPLVTWLGFRFGSAVLTQLRGSLRWVVLGVIALAVVAMVVKLVRRRSLVRATLATRPTAPAPVPTPAPVPAPTVERDSVAQQ
jgi:membrane protein DedA with SNARE-associated domain